MVDIKPSEDVPLAAEFPPATREAWLKLVDGALKGRSFDKLVSRSRDAIPIGPIYSRATKAAPIAGRAAGSPWRIMQRVDHPDAAAANALALEDLENGATGLTLTFAGAVGARGFGLSADGIARMLDGVHLDAGVALELDLPSSSEGLVESLASLVRERNLAPASVDIRFGLDPIGALAHGGWMAQPWKGAAPRLAATVVDLALRGFKGPFVVADARPVQAAGGSEAQELAFALACAVSYLRALEGGGMHLDAARRTISFRMAADADQFLTIAKFRALRKLWTRIEEACGLVPLPALVSAETAWRMMTKRDAHVNLLRTTMAAFSAALGGADAIAVLPFTIPLGLPDSFARRMARNTQLLLAEESNLAKVSDPSAGSGGVEDLTDGLCSTAWATFQEIERAGGAAAALETGLFQEKVAVTRAERERAVAHRTEVLTGTSEFPQLRELPPAVLGAVPETLPAAPANAVRIKPLVPFRLAEPFEALRDAADRALAATGARRRVFLATLGAPADFTARATFARNLFEAGGIEAVGGERYSDHVELRAAFKQSRAHLACLCSSDEVYERDAAAAARALAEAGAAHVYLAGRPGEREAMLAEAGVKGFVYAGCDVVATLQSAHAILVRG